MSRVLLCCPFEPKKPIAKDHVSFDRLASHYKCLRDQCLNESEVTLLHLQAFAWFSDLLVEHTEIFWSLFAVDMNSILAQQPPDTWDSFPLFQVLNNYLRLDGK